MKDDKNIDAFIAYAKIKDVDYFIDLKYMISAVQTFDEYIFHLATKELERRELIL